MNVDVTLVITSGGQGNQLLLLVVKAVKKLCVFIPYYKRHYAGLSERQT